MQQLYLSTFHVGSVGGSSKKRDLNQHLAISFIIPYKGKKAHDMSIIRYFFSVCTFAKRCVERVHAWVCCVGGMCHE